MTASLDMYESVPCNLCGADDFEIVLKPPAAE